MERCGERVCVCVVCIRFSYIYTTHILHHLRWHQSAFFLILWPSNTLFSIQVGRHFKVLQIKKSATNERSNLQQSYYICWRPVWYRAQFELGVNSFILRFFLESQGKPCKRHLKIKMYFKIGILCISTCVLFVFHPKRSAYSIRTISWHASQGGPGFDYSPGHGAFLFPLGALLSPPTKIMCFRSIYSGDAPFAAAQDKASYIHR